MLNYLRLSQSFYLKKTTGAEDSMRVGLACVHRLANKEKAVLKGKVIPGAGVTLNHQNFPQYVGKFISGKINCSSFHPSLHPFIVLEFVDRRIC